MSDATAGLLLYALIGIAAMFVMLWPSIADMVHASHPDLTRWEIGAGLVVFGAFAGVPTACYLIAVDGLP